MLLKAFPCSSPGTTAVVERNSILEIRILKQLLRDVMPKEPLNVGCYFTVAKSYSINASK